MNIILIIEYHKLILAKTHSVNFVAHEINFSCTNIRRIETNVHVLGESKLKPNQAETHLAINLIY